MYRAYLKLKTPHGSEVDKTSRTNTPSSSAAEVAYRELINRADLAGQPWAAVLTLNNRPLMYHRFDVDPGDADFVGLDDEIILQLDD